MTCGFIDMDYCHGMIKVFVAERGEKFLTMWIKQTGCFNLVKNNSCYLCYFAKAIFSSEEFLTLKSGVLNSHA